MRNKSRKTKKKLNKSARSRRTSSSNAFSFKYLIKLPYNLLLYLLHCLALFFQLLTKIVFWPIKTAWRITVYLLEKVGFLTIFLVSVVIRLPSVPFLLVWELYLITTNANIRNLRFETWKENYWSARNKLAGIITAITLARIRLILKLSTSRDPGIRFCFAFVRTPVRFLATAVVMLGLAGNFYFFVFKDLPSPYKLKKSPALSTKIFARDCSTLLYKIYRNENRTLMPLQQIPPIARLATIAIEDKDFYRHHGYSFTGIFRALKNNLNNEKVQGGSTITQQLIKNTVLTSERTYERKVKELVLSIEAELIFSKDQILQMYLNEVAYGGPAYGIEEASQMYLGKSAKNINLAEASFLAGLPAAPSNYSPYTAGLKVAKERQKEVLKQMVKNGFVSLSDARVAYTQPLKILPPLTPIHYPHFVMFAKDELIAKYGKKAVEEEGLSVCTTLDPAIQDLAQKVVTDEVGKIKVPYRVNNGAALVTNPSTGEILAMVGSVDYWDKENDGNVNLTTSLRQPGSSIKIVNYSYALAHGYTPNTILQDTPVSYRNAWETYTPVNYDGKFRGSVTLRSALAMSLNIPAVKVLASYGVDKMVEQGKMMGITTWNDPQRYGLSLTLGAAEVKMTDMAVVYGTIANEGRRVNLNSFLKIVDNEGRVLVDRGVDKPALALAKDVSAKEPEDEVVPPLVAYQLIDILSDNVARTPEFGPRSALYIPNAKVAAKTGTSNSFRDNWTFGFTPNLLVSAWVGNNDNTPMSGIASGITGAAPIWNGIMTQLIKDRGAAEFATPSGLIKVKICATNGLLTCKGCSLEKDEYFVPGTEPKKACFMPSPSDCQAKKTQLEAEGKKAEEIVAALQNCPLATASPSTNP